MSEAHVPRSVPIQSFDANSGLSNRNNKPKALRPVHFTDTDSVTACIASLNVFQGHE